MFDLDHWREICDALTANKLRTLLTAFGVFWGVFMLMVMLGSGNGLENGVSQDFADSATNSFFVWTRRTAKPYAGLPAGRAFDLTNDDRQAIIDQVPEARIVAPRNQLGGFGSGNGVSRGSESGSFNVMGDYPEIRFIEKVRVTEGRFLNKLDVEQKRKVAVIGARVRDLLFESDEDPIGDSVRIRGVYFKVVGVFRSASGGDDADRETRTIYTPFTTFQQTFNFGNVVGWFAITSRDELPASVAEERVLTLLAQRHRVHPDDERAFGHYNQEEEYLEVRGLFAGIRALVWIVGIGTLAAGVIGVSNIMLVIVRERTREIGIRRAIGATPLSIMGQIVLEALLLTSVAGYAGLIAGMGLVDLIDSLVAGGGAGAFRHPEVSLTSAMQALAILVASGVLAGLIPGRRAVSVPPVEALRGD